MFDTMTMTKIAASLCGALLVLLLGKWAAEATYHVGGHGSEQAYVIDTGADESAEEAVEVAFADVLATADAGAGSKVFRKCSACHKLESGANGAGPYLYGVVGRDIGSADGFGGYSSDLANLEGNWTPEALNEFLTNPKRFAAGTTMNFAGLSKIEDRANVVAYLDSIDD